MNKKLFLFVVGIVLLPLVVVLILKQGLLGNKPQSPPKTTQSQVVDEREQVYQTVEFDGEKFSQSTLSLTLKKGLGRINLQNSSPSEVKFFMTHDVGNKREVYEYVIEGKSKQFADFEEAGMYIINTSNKAQGSVNISVK